MQLKLKKKSAAPEPSAADAPKRAPKPGKKRKVKKRKSGAKPTGKGCFILTIGDEGGILLYMRGSVVVRRLFAPSAQPIHTEAMTDLMRSRSKTPLYLLTDVLDQQYVRQTFPPVSSLSLNSLIKRRLDRDFQAEDIKGAIPLGRDKTGRKEWNYLLVSLARTPLLQAWLDMVLELPNEFKGVLLLPVEATLYMEHLQKAITGEKPQPWQLLVSHHKVSGFRQVVMRDGKLMFTRVTQVTDDAIPAVIAGNIEQEIINTIEYLRRLGFQDNATLDAYIIASPDVGDALDMRRFAFGTSNVLTPLDVSDLLGLEQAALSADRFGDVVLASALGREKKHALRLSTAYADKLANLYLFNRAAKVIAGLIVLVFLGLAAQNVAGILSDRSHIAEKETKRQGTQSKLNEQKAIVKDLKTDVSFHTAVIAAYDNYVKVEQQPLEFMEKLNAVLTPDIRVQDVEWSKVGIAPLHSGATALAVPKPGATPTVTGPLMVRIKLDFAGDYATAQDLDKAADALLASFTNKMPEYDVTHDPFPWHNEAEKSASISLDQSATAAAGIKGDGCFLTFYGPKKIDAKAKPGGGA